MNKMLSSIITLMLFTVMTYAQKVRTTGSVQPKLNKTNSFVGNPDRCPSVKRTTKPTTTAMHQKSTDKVIGIGTDIGVKRAKPKNTVVKPNQ